ncbi:hypothetical protein ACFOY8_14930 [Thalassospira xianhensis]|uniref:Uncharacterized protein n=1 Tax=Thalassospira xianhensis MCCC 1A02616 TaxID=1177929 RepID=A0A367UHR6_9PROT|nr:hypothetical protein [Thalassospira xianhensis]RCK07560.1 hypothetical protein TH5_00295 [Thalassospira xianhensis MCCC 1A02616]
MKTRLFDIPFMYQITHIPPRCQKERWAKVRDVLTLAIQEVPEDEAPLAMVVTLPGGKKIDYRWHQGRLLSYNENCGVPQDDILEVFARFAEIKDHSLERIAIEAITKQTHSDRQRVVARIISSASDLRIIGDQLWTPATEPVWELREVHGTRTYSSLRPNVSWWSAEPSLDIESGNMYRADEKEVALALDTASNTVVDGDIEVLLPEVVRHQLDAAFLTYACEQTWAWTSMECFRKGTCEFFAAYAGIRDALLEMYAEGGDARNGFSGYMAPDLIEHAVAYLNEHDRLFSREEFGDRRRIQILRHAVQRYEYVQQPSLTIETSTPRP